MLAIFIEVGYAANSAAGISGSGELAGGDGLNDNLSFEAFASIGLQKLHIGEARSGLVVDRWNQ